MTYKNKSNLRLEIPGVGVVEPGGTIDTDQKLENQYLEVVTNTQPVPTAQPQQPTAPVAPKAPETPVQPEGGSK